MSDIIIKSISYLLVIVVISYFKSKNKINSSTTRILSTIMLSYTLPCVIINNMNGIEFNSKMILVLLLGILFNGLSILFGAFVGKKDKPFTIINISGYNIGCFALPFVSGIFDKASIITTSFFDIGNSIMCLGTTYGICQTIKSGGKFNIKFLITKILHSVPVVTYAVMILLSLLNINLPESFLTIIKIPSSANAFLAMAVIGSSLTLKINRTKAKTVVSHILYRLIVSISLALFVSFLPITYTIKRVIIILTFAPISAASVAYTESLESDTETSASINSLYVLISLVIMSILVGVL